VRLSSRSLHQRKFAGFHPDTVFRLVVVCCGWQLTQLPHL
jgi:hypothetical protein